MTKLYTVFISLFLHFSDNQTVLFLSFSVSFDLIFCSSESVKHTKVTSRSGHDTPHERTGRLLVLVRPRAAYLVVIYTSGLTTSKQLIVY